MGSLNLSAGAVVYVDTQVLIYTVERHAVYGPLLRPVWETAKSATVQVISSELSLLETLVQPIRTGNVALQSDYQKALLTTELRLLPITRAVLLDAARLRAGVAALRTPDAIHAATAQAAGCTMFLTNDRGLRQVPGLPVVLLDDVLAA